MYLAHLSLCSLTSPSAAASPEGWPTVAPPVFNVTAPSDDGCEDEEGSDFDPKDHENRLAKIIIF